MARQTERRAIHGGITRHCIQGHVASGEDRAQHMPRTPQQRANARNQLFIRKRLDKVIVGAGIEALDAILDAVACRQHQHRQSARRTPNTFDKPQDVAVGQAEIEDARIIRNALNVSSRVVEASSLVDAEATILKGGAHVAPQTIIVLNNKYPHAELLASSPKTTLKERV